MISSPLLGDSAEEVLQFYSPIHFNGNGNIVNNNIQIY
jgi:hypothetical protein